MSSPAVVHNSSAARPTRTQSTAVRSTAAPPTASPHRSLSQSHGHARPSHPAQQAPLNQPKRDFDQKLPPRRSESRDRAAPQPDNRSNSHNRHARYGPDSSATAAATNGATTEQPRHAPPNNASGRRRTTISAQTGQWALGKTIGAGSMGKVKLARNLETGEQVRIAAMCMHTCGTKLTPYRLRSKSYPGSLPTSTATKRTASGLIIPRRYGPQGKRPL